MTHLIKGANTPVPTALLGVAVGRDAVPGTPSVAASALLLDSTGRVRGDADLVLHRRPVHPSGAVRHLGGGQGDGRFAEWLELDLPAVEPDVRRVVIAGSCDGGVFGDIPGLYVRAVAVDGTVAAQYAVTDAGAETAFVLGEFYRRDGAWKFRAVGQGYDSGLTALATDFGVEPGAAASSGPVPLTGVSKVRQSLPGAPAGPAAGSAAQGPAAAGLSASKAPEPAAAGLSATSSAPEPTATGLSAMSNAPEPAAASTAPPAASRPSVPVESPFVPEESPFHGPDFFDFEPYVVSGAGSDTGVEKVTVTVDIPFPPNCAPVIVEAEVAEGRHQSIYVQMPGRSDDVFGHDLPDRHGSRLFVPPRKGGPVKLIVRANTAWTLTVRPLSAARPIGPGTVRGRGPQVFAYGGGTEADVKIRVRDREKHWFRLTYYKNDESLPLKDDRYLHADSGRIKETVRIPEGPLLLVVEYGVNEWELTLDPLPAPPKAREPEPEGHRIEETDAGEAGRSRETAVYDGPGPVTGVYEGRGPMKVTLVNPRPGRPALVRYVFEGGRHSDMEVSLVGSDDSWLSGVTAGMNGTSLLFGAGEERQTVRIQHEGDWSLRLVPEEEAQLITGPVEGSGSTVLRHQGPAMLMRVRQTVQGGAGGITAWTLNHPTGRKLPIVGIWAGLRPQTGPVRVDPDGSCFVLLRADERTKWRLEPIPLDTLPVIGERTEGSGFGVVRHIGPEAELRFSAPDPESRPFLKVDILDENLSPGGSIASSFGTHRVPGGFLQIRSDGRWAIERPGEKD